MAQVVTHDDGTKSGGGASVGRLHSQSPSKLGVDRSQKRVEDASICGLQSSKSILSALGDESSRRILASAIASGRSVKEISAEQNLPLSTCHRRIRHFVDEGLMILERLVITQTGKRFAIYRTSFSDVAIRFYCGEVAVEITPNLEVLDKLRTRWISTNYPSLNQDAGFRYGRGLPQLPSMGNRPIPVGRH
jgi:predicted methyltransferase